VRAQLQQQLAKAIDAKQVEVEMEQRGLVISIREAGSFATSRSELSATAQDILAKVGLAVASVGNSVRIEGHTDDVPIHTDRYESNWELSTSRATTVVRFMLERAILPPQRLSAAGYAEYMPREPGTSDAARSRNRRVDIIVLSAPTQAAEEPIAASNRPPGQ
jgi:chemotaxis protein MotB